MRKIKITFFIIICSLSLLFSVNAVAGLSDVQERPGKSVVNHGHKPLKVIVTKADGSHEEIQVPPRTAVPLPAGTTRVDRDTISRDDMSARDSRVTVSGDGNEVDLPGTRDGSSVALDPNRPTVVKPGRQEVTADTERNITRQDGKSVVNHGHKPLKVIVTKADGSHEEIQVPPRTAVPLPAGTTRVDRDTISRDDMSARDSRVTVSGDGSEVELPGTQDGSSVALDPNRPTVVKPGRQEVTADTERNITRQDGKSVVNHGHKPLKVIVTKADGSHEEIQVPPRTAVPLPAGTTRVDRDTISRDDMSAKDSRVTVAGDGSEVDLPGTQDGSSVALDPNRPTVVKPGRQEVTADTERNITRQDGKSVVNHGHKPLKVIVTKADGSHEEIQVPPRTAVPLPAGTTRVDRDTISRDDMSARDSRVTVSGDGSEVDLPGTAEGSSVALDPNRPTVVKPGRQEVTADTGRNITRQDGKSVVNHGHKPLKVIVTKADGSHEEIQVPPRTAVPLPAGTTRVDRDTISRDDMSAKDSRVTVSGDGKEVDLPGTAEGSSVALDPNRPSVVKPGAREVTADSERDIAGQDGKSVVNHGHKPLKVIVTKADGSHEEIQVPPRTAVPLPAGTTRVDRDTISRDDMSAKDSRVTVSGDGKEVELPGTADGSSVALDPNRPDVVVSEEKDLADGDEDAGAETPAVEGEAEPWPDSQGTGDQIPCGGFFSFLTDSSPVVNTSTGEDSAFGRSDKLKNRGTARSNPDAQGMGATAAPSVHKC